MVVSTEAYVPSLVLQINDSKRPELKILAATFALICAVGAVWLAALILANVVSMCQSRIWFTVVGMIIWKLLQHHHRFRQQFSETTIQPVKGPQSDSSKKVLINVIVES